MKPDIALTIAGSDSGGGAGIQADLKTFSALGIHGLCVLTSVTAQNTKGVEGINDLSGDFVGKQIDTVVDDFDVKWGKTGMLSSQEIIRAVQDRAEKHNLKLVVDPVMVAASGSSLLREKAFENLKDLVGTAELVTPNIPEAEKLADLKIEIPDDAQKAARRIGNLGPKNVLVKGGHLNTGDVKNFLYTKDEIREFETPRIAVDEIHGTGCTFSSAITAKLAKGKDMETAVEEAGQFMVRSIRGRLEMGGGVETVNPMAEMWKVTGGVEEVTEVQKAAREIVNRKKFCNLIPEVGVNIAMAKPGAEKIEDVIGLNGRIVKVEGKPYQTGIPAPGGSEHVASIILAVMDENPNFRSAMNVKFSEEILEKCRDLDFKISDFDRKREPEDIRTMEWGPKRAIEKLGEVPDLIYDRGAVGKEPMIRVIGKTAGKVTQKSLNIMKKMDF